MMEEGHSRPIKGVLNKLSIKDLNISGKRLFIRVDFNVPLDENLNITDDRRIRSTLPDRKSTRLNSSHTDISRMPSSA